MTLPLRDDLPESSTVPVSDGERLHSLFLDAAAELGKITPDELRGVGQLFALHIVYGTLHTIIKKVRKARDRKT